MVRAVAYLWRSRVRQTNHPGWSRTSVDAPDEDKQRTAQTCRHETARALTIVRTWAEVNGRRSTACDSAGTWITPVPGGENSGTPTQNGGLSTAPGRVQSGVKRFDFVGKTTYRHGKSMHRTSNGGKMVRIQDIAAGCASTGGNRLAPRNAERPIGVSS